MKLLINRSVSQVHNWVMKGEELTAFDQSEKDRLDLGKIKKDQTDIKTHDQAETQLGQVWPPVWSALMITVSLFSVHFTILTSLSVCLFSGLVEPGRRFFTSPTWCAVPHTSTTCLLLVQEMDISMFGPTGSEVTLWLCKKLNTVSVRMWSVNFSQCLKFKTCVLTVEN